mgnify:CR=1 FL=1
MFSHGKYLLVLLLLLLLFAAYNYTLYTTQSDYGTIRLSEKALQGEKHWRENNCNACHQLYGLGGYLGPDLTNVYSFRKGDVQYLKSMFNSGVKAMPRFDFNETEMKGTFITYPERESVPENIKEQLIVELYSK